METPIEISIDSILESGLSSPLVFLVYLGKLFLPFNLSVYPILEDTSLLWGIFSILILGSVLIFCRKKLDWKKVIFALVWFVIFLAPSLIRPNPDIKSDYLEHRLYLPFIGFLVLALSVFETNVLKNYLKPLLIIALLLILAVINLNHQNNFKNRISFWENAVTNSPHSPLANRNYGAMLYLDGDLERAKGYFEKALELNSNEQMAHNNLGVIYMEKGDYEKAEEEFSKEVEINQGYVSAYSNLGILYLKMEKYDEALKNLEIAVQLNPSDLSLYYNALVACVNLEDVECTKDLLSFFEKFDIEIDEELIEKTENVLKE
jgi:tetratricopeptide (TPR) repeat protein